MNIATEKDVWTLNSTDTALIALALEEDLGKPFRDITTLQLFLDTRALSTVKVISKNKEPIVLSGLPVVQAIIDVFKGVAVVDARHQEGDVIMPGETLFLLSGESVALLMAERTILNFLQHLCAVATLTKKYVDAVAETRMKILDTRKTLPGFRHLDKYAVCCGGGANHRMGLYDAILVKDTHVDLLGGMSKALSYLHSRERCNFPVIVEVRDMNELSIVLSEGREKVTRVLLDNMSPELMTECVQRCAGVFETEASGNLSLENIRRVAETGVGYASVGRLTHSAGSVDLSMMGL